METGYTLFTCPMLVLLKVETGYNLLIAHIHTGLLAVTFYLLFGAAPINGST